MSEYKPKINYKQHKAIKTLLLQEACSKARNTSQKICKDQKLKSLCNTILLNAKISLGKF